MYNFTVIWEYWRGGNGDAGFDTKAEAERYFNQRVDDASTESFKLIELVDNRGDEPSIIEAWSYED